MLTPVCAQVRTARSQRPGPEEKTPFLLTAPIQEGEPSPIDIRFARLNLSISPESGLIAGRLLIWFTIPESDSSTVFIPLTGVSIDSVRAGNMEVPAASIAAELDSSSLGIWLSRSKIDPAEEYRLSVYFSPHIHVQTDPLGIRNGPWKAVWVDGSPGSEEWLPVSSTLDDWFSSDFRVRVPPGWNVRLPGKSDYLIEGTQGTTFRAVSVSEGSMRQFSFAAYQTENQNMLSIVDSTSGSYFRSWLRQNGVSDFRKDAAFISIRGGGFPASSDPSLVFLPESTRTLDGGLPQSGGFDPSAFAQSWTMGRIRVSGWTDSWILPAFAEVLSLLYVKETQGEEMYTDRLIHLKNSYLEEADVYRRPLVWDRWNFPTDLLDGHARAKGPWVLTMLIERFGERAFWRALKELEGIASHRPIDTETVREAFERATESSLRMFFDEWVYGAGHPVLSYTYTVRQDQTALDLNVRQIQTGGLTQRLFHLSLPVEAVSLVGIDSSTIALSEREATVGVAISLRPQHILFDRNDQTLLDLGQTLKASDLVSSLRRFRDTRSRLVATNDLRQLNVDGSLLLGLRPVWTSARTLSVRKNLLAIFSKMAPSESALKLVLQASEDSSAAIRAASIQALSSWSGSKEARRAVIRAANTDQNENVLAAAVISLSTLDPSLAPSVLESALITRTRNDTVRRTAFALIPAILDATRASKMLLPVLRNDNQKHGLPHASRDQLIASLAEISDDSDVRRMLLSLWPTSGLWTRFHILELIENTDPGLLKRSSSLTSVKAWFQSEPTPVIRRRLESLLQQL